MKSFIGLTFLTMFIASMYGYFANLVALIGSTEIVGLTIVRAIGVVVPPIGILMGFF